MIEGKPTLAEIANPTTHYGSPKASTRHFITQRVTGALLVFFLLFFVWFVASVAGEGRATMVATIANPFVAVVLALLIVTATVHMRNGMRDTLEDYLTGGAYKLAMAANTGFSLLVAVLALGAIAKIVFWG